MCKVLRLLLLVQSCINMLLFFLCVCHHTSHPAQHLAFIFYYIYYIYTYIIHIISYQYITYIFISSRIYFIKYFIISKELYYIHGGVHPWLAWGGGCCSKTNYMISHTKFSNNFVKFLVQETWHKGGVQLWLNIPPGKSTYL